MRPSHSIIPSRLVLAAIATLAATSAAPAHAGVRVSVESVNDYSFLCGNTSCDINNSVANGNGFVNAMVSTSVWTRGVNYANASVYDSDFVDPQKSASGQGSDTYNFDRPGDGISYFTGHGIDQLGGSTCTTSADCAVPVPGTNQAGVCRSSPPNNRFCVYPSSRALVTSSAQDTFGHLIKYGNGETALGEGYYGILGAGTNGGINLAVLDISHGVTAPFWNQELAPALVGVHLLATIMPINGDTANSPNRGSTFANKYVVNPSGSVATAWVDTLNSLPQSGYSPCSGANANDYTYGGGRGINGCGCNFIMSVDGTTTGVSWHVNTESWGGLQLDSNDATAHYYSTWTAVCNYDSNTYPWSI